SLFPGGVGRTWCDEDFRTLLGDVEERVFGSMADDKWVYTGHGGDTTLGAERPRRGEWRERGGRYHPPQQQNPARPRWPATASGAGVPEAKARWKRRMADPVSTSRTGTGLATTVCAPWPNNAPTKPSGGPDPPVKARPFQQVDKVTTDGTRGSPIRSQASRGPSASSTEASMGTRSGTCPWPARCTRSASSKLFRTEWVMACSPVNT